MKRSHFLWKAEERKTSSRKGYRVGAVVLLHMLTAEVPFVSLPKSVKLKPAIGVSDDSTELVQA